MPNNSPFVASVNELLASRRYPTIDTGIELANQMFHFFVMYHTKSVEDVFESSIELPNESGTIAGFTRTRYLRATEVVLILLTHHYCKLSFTGSRNALGKLSLVVSTLRQTMKMKSSHITNGTK
jgi:hypothetical protein